MSLLCLQITIKPRKSISIKEIARDQETKATHKKTIQKPAFLGDISALKEETYRKHREEYEKPVESTVEPLNGIIIRDIIKPNNNYSEYDIINKLINEKGLEEEEAWKLLFFEFFPHLKISGKKDGIYYFYLSGSTPF